MPAKGMREWTNYRLFRALPTRCGEFHGELGVCKGQTPRKL